MANNLVELDCQETVSNTLPRQVTHYGSCKNRWQQQQMAPCLCGANAYPYHLYL
jgi:hypothetical protein